MPRGTGEQRTASGNMGGIWHEIEPLATRMRVTAP